MSRSRFVRPDTAILPLSDGDTITIRKRLTAGEQRAMFTRMYDQAGRVDRSQVGLSLVLAYLLDWTFTDDEGRIVRIADQPINVVEGAINALYPETFDEMQSAIEQHIEESAAEREKLKNARGGGKESSPISPSLDSSGGGTSGSVN